MKWNFYVNNKKKWFISNKRSLFYHLYNIKTCHGCTKKVMLYDGFYKKNDVILFSHMERWPMSGLKRKMENEND